MKIPDVIEAKISDHYPLLHNGIFFWNIMKQGSGYDNGFGLKENQAVYQARLKRVADVITYTIRQYPTTEIITLCEGPIQDKDVTLFVQSLLQSRWMKKFLRWPAFFKPEVTGPQPWGLMLFADKNYDVERIQYTIVTDKILSDKMANRFQIWRLTNSNVKKYIALSHFPYFYKEQNEDAIDEKQLVSGKWVTQLANRLLQQFSNVHFIFAADFNLNPFVISQYRDRYLDQIPVRNSVMLDVKHTLKPVTVDGILLSHKAKQYYLNLRGFPGLFSRLKIENGLAETSCQDKDRIDKKQYFD